VFFDRVIRLYLFRVDIKRLDCYDFRISEGLARRIISRTIDFELLQAGDLIRIPIRSLDKAAKLAVSDCDYGA
jgi:hypothetical protein